MSLTRIHLATISAVLLVAALVATSPVGAQTIWTCNGIRATIVGTEGPDTLRGTSGIDVIVARQGDDIIDGLEGDDIICAGKGNDRVIGGEGFDIIFGAQGNDTIFAANGAASSDREDVRGARMFGGQGNDTIHGTNRWDRMQGGPGSDLLFGYEGRDWMRGGADSDIVDGGPGIDDLHGGNGRDTIELTSGDAVKGGAGLDQCNIAVGAAGSLRSCGQNEREAPKSPPRPVEVTACDARTETVVLTNNEGFAFDLTAWVVQDEGPNFEVNLDGRTIPAKGTLTLLSGTGSEPGGPGVYRWSDRNVWNNAGDTVFLFDANGNLVSTFPC